jgi:hypothetical protein
MVRRKDARSCEMSAFSALDVLCSCTQLPVGPCDRKIIVAISMSHGPRKNKQLLNGDVGREYDHTFENPTSP